MFKHEFLVPFQQYIRKTLQLVFFVSIGSFLFLFYNLFLLSGLVSLALIILDFSNQDTPASPSLGGSSQKMGALHNREKLWIFLVAISLGIFVWQRTKSYGLGAFPLSLVSTILSFFFLRALLEKPSLEKSL